MEWLKAILEAQGLEPEVINKILESYKTESVKYTMPKDKFNEVNEAKKQLEKDIKDRDNQLEELKKSAKTGEELQAEIARLQEENKTAKETYEANLYNIRLTNEIDKQLIAAKAKDLKIAKAAFNMENVKLENGELVGFSDQLKSIQDSHGYLFGGDEESPSGTGGSMGNKEKQNNDVDPFLKGMGLI